MLQADFSTIHSSVCCNDNFVVIEVVEIKVVAVSLGETAAKCIYNGFDFLVGKNTVCCLFFNIENLRFVRYFYRS